MRKLILLLLFIPLVSFGQNNKYEKNVKSIDSIIQTLYSVISGDKGVERNWNLFKYLFHNDAKLIPSGTSDEGVKNARFISPDEYISGSGKWLFENGFHENEIGRITEHFGNIAHIFSSYESFRAKTDTIPFSRGINSIQLLFDGNRWWILNVYWMSESNINIIPKKYLF